MGNNVRVKDQKKKERKNSFVDKDKWSDMNVGNRERK